MRITPAIISIGTAVPATKIDQKVLSEAVCNALPENDRYLNLLVRKLYRSSGIATRYTVLDSFPHPGQDGTFIPPERREHNGPTTEERNTLYKKRIVPLAAQAVKNAIVNAGITVASEITHCITASCTGFFSPGFDVELIKQAELRSETPRIMVGFMGCFAALPALRIAHALCIAEPEAVVLVVCAELCSLHYRHTFDQQTLLANSLFSDGAAAAIVTAKKQTSGKSKLFLKRFYSELLKNSQNEMEWMIGNHGFKMTLSQKVPRLIADNIMRLFKECTGNSLVNIKDIPHWAIHPGGRAILDLTGRTLGLSATALNNSRHVLKNYGNMSSATILFVLKEFLDARVKGDLVTAAFGPGLVAELALMEAQ